MAAKVKSRRDEWAHNMTTNTEFVNGKLFLCNRYSLQKNRIYDKSWTQYNALVQRST